MSGERNENEDRNVKAFGAALAALRPRAGRLDCRWRSLLAKEAALTATIVGDATLPSPFGRGAGGEGCVDPAGHRFMCIHCGSDARVVRGAGRWAWPAAFSGMTAVAAVLLVMFATRWGPRLGEQSPTTPAPLVVQQRVDTDWLEENQASGDWLAHRRAARPPRVSGVDEMCYLDLRNQVLRYGVDSWKPPASAVVTSDGPTEGPLSYREQLDRLLKQQGLRGS